MVVSMFAIVPITASAATIVDPGILSGNYEAKDGDVTVNAPTAAKLTLNVGESGKVVMDSGTFGNATDASNIADISTPFTVNAVSNIIIEDDHTANLVEGGSITIATGGYDAAGIGSGYYGSCAGITIEDTVIKVTAVKGDYAPYSVGAGEAGTCGNVTIGGVETGNIADSTYIYEP